MAEHVIEVEDLTKNYGDVTAIDGVSFSVNEGEIFSLVGPNGAGKTTTVEILECLREPTSGKAKVLGHDIRKEEMKIKEQIGVMPQDFNTFDRLTAKENIKLAADIYDKSGAEEIIKKVGVKEFENKRFEDLSGGMKTRVGIGMALVSDAPLLFLDEPTTGLDPQARRETWSLIKGLKRMNKTVFLTTHYMEEVEELSDRAAVIIDGDIKITDSISNLIERYGGGVKITASKEKGAEELIKKNSDEVTEEDKDELTGIFEDREKARKTLISLFKKDCNVSVEEAGMDEVFLELAGGKLTEEGELA
ncbi:MAG: ABC transporter ATP-binding protein [Candidatus Thermoplasmatota archaeon]|nr:ABC transporter ATP-binding protein [Candidatus Thermoplasmatota archaeon]